MSLLPGSLCSALLILMPPFQFLFDVVNAFLSQFADTQTYTKTLHKIYLLEPASLVLPLTMMEPAPSKLVSLIFDAFPDLNIVPLQRKYFNDGSGMLPFSLVCLCRSMSNGNWQLSKKRIRFNGALRNGPSNRAFDSTMCVKVLCYHGSSCAFEVLLFFGLSDLGNLERTVIE